MGLFCGVLWVCFVVAVGLLVVLYWWWLCRIFFILFVISDFVWSGLRKKIGDLVFFFFFPHCGLVVVVAVVDGRGGCG